MSNVVNEYHPDVVSPPGETLQEILDTIGMSQAQLARRTGRPTKTINEIIKGKAAITPETALQLERVLRVPAAFWLRREQHYRESIARRKEREGLATQTEWLRSSKIPWKEMVSKGWIDPSDPDDPVQVLEAVLSFFGITSPLQWSALGYQTYFRQSHAYEINHAAVAAWLRKGELEAYAVHCAPYNPHRFRDALGKARALTLALPEVFVPELRAVCAAAGVAVVFVPELSGSRVSGATRWLSPTKALIQLSLRYKTDDQWWFSFFHEAGHIVLHGKSEVFLETEDEEAVDSKETEANTFAADLLIPPAQMARLRHLIPAHGRFISLEKIRKFSDEIGIAPGIVVGRLQHEGLLPYTHGNGLKVRLKLGRVVAQAGS
jgi:addiction module HigA family antidote